MNRNIITRRAAAAARARPFDAGRPGRLPGVAPDKSSAEGGRAKPTEADAWYVRLLKYIPGEAVGLYLFLDNLCKTALPLPKPSAGQTAAEYAAAAAAEVGKQQPWLAAALAVAVVFNWVYLWRVWKVERVWQRAVSCLALVVYVFAIGGVFATFSWYVPTLGLAALAVGAAFLGFVEPPEKPPGPDPDPTRGP